MSRLDAALAYAAKGWPVFPLRGKLPAISKGDGGRGVHDATTEKDKIKAWWTRYPNSNIGLACGEAAGFWALDVDPRHDGDETLAQLEKTHGALPTTVEQITGGGGRHVLFRYNGQSIRNRVNSLGAGLDVRATGGYIVAPPSCHPETKRPYAWNVDAHPDDVEIADAPDWLLERVAGRPQEQEQEPQQQETTQPDPFFAFGQRAAKSGTYAEAALAREAEAVAMAAPGQQEHTLNAAALKIGSLVGAGLLDFDHARDALTEAGARMTNEPEREPWTRDQIVAKVERGLRDGMATPRQVAETQEAPRDRRLKPIPWAELASLPRREPLVKGILDVGAMSVTYGPTNCGKTFLALDLACHVAIGRDFFGRTTRQGAVVYVASEGGLGIEERLTAFRFHHDVEPTAPLYVVPAAPDLCNTKRDAAELVREIGPLEPALVVIDTLSRAMAGGNENSPDDMGAFVSACDLIRQKTAAHLFVIHHSGKDEGRGTRGHSLLNGAVDTLLEVNKDDAGALFTATVKKQRDRASGDVLAFRLEPVDIGMDDDDNMITSCVVMPSDEQVTRRARVSGAAKIALDMLVRAIDEAGEKPPPHIQPQIGFSGQNQVVRSSLWRRYVNTSSITSSDRPDSKDKAFKRSAEKLQSLGIIRAWDDWVWLTGQTGQDRTKRKCPTTTSKSGPDRHPDTL